MTRNHSFSLGFDVILRDCIILHPREVALSYFSPPQKKHIIWFSKWWMHSSTLINDNIPYNSGKLWNPRRVAVPEIGDPLMESHVPNWPNWHIIPWFVNYWCFTTIKYIISITINVYMIRNVSFIWPFSFPRLTWKLEAVWLSDCHLWFNALHYLLKKHMKLYSSKILHICL